MYTADVGMKTVGADCSSIHFKRCGSLHSPCSGCGGTMLTCSPGGKVKRVWPILMKLSAGVHRSSTKAYEAVTTREPEEDRAKSNVRRSVSCLADIQEKNIVDWKNKAYCCTVTRRPLPIKRPPVFFRSSEAPVPTHSSTRLTLKTPLALTVHGKERVDKNGYRA
jgi:hypothetical protein